VDLWGRGFSSPVAPGHPGVRPWYCSWQKRERCDLLMSQYFNMLHWLDIMHLPPSTPELRNCRCDPWGKLLTITPAATIKMPQQASGREACLSNRFDTVFNNASVNICQCLRDRCTYEKLKSLCVVENKALHECFPDFSFCCEVLLFWKTSHPEMQKSR